ncbi:MAG: acetylxylan esterase [Bryobacteraceae bacterium]
MRTAILCLSLCLPALSQSTEELDFLSKHTDFRNLRARLGESMRRRAFALLDERERKVRQWTPADASARRAYVREKMLRSLGGLPERTPLNARVTGTIEKDDYRIEKIVFESQPRFFVTANLYLPKKGQPPYPAVLFPLGHETGGKSNPTWQQMLISLAKRGYVALAWDPLGQGERIQIYDEDLGASKVGSSTVEHTVLGMQCLLAGDNVARYTIWDGLRAMDYLVSRKEVDATRIACTGNSGGGTHTAYLSALDDRIQVAAPSCYITSWRRLLESIGPQDAEQCLTPPLADGLDQADYVLAFAPKPYLILSAIRDFFSITGARETFSEAKSVYGLLNASDRISMTEADDGHGYTKPRRMAAYRWFARWLKNTEDNEPEPEADLATEEELRATASGQVATSLGGETVDSLNRKRASALRRGTPSLEDVQRLTGYAKPSGSVKTRSFGEIAKEGYRIEKLIYESDADTVIPALVFVPATGAAKKPTLLVVDGRGKSAAAGEVEAFVRAGYIVMAIDARGFGESRSALDTKGGEWTRYFGDFDSAMTAMVTGTTLTGLRAVDIARGVDLLSSRADVDGARISALGRGNGCISLLHVAVFDSRIRALGLEGMLVSYESVVAQRIHRGIVEHVIPGVLKTYDLPDLAARMTPRRVRLADLSDPVGQLVPIEKVRALYPRAEVTRRRPESGAAQLWEGLF